MKPTRPKGETHPALTQLSKPTPCEVALVRHLARMAAEKDYKEFLATGKLPQTSMLDEEA